VALGTHELEIHALQATLGFNGNVIPFKGIGPIWLELIANRMDATLSASAPPQLKTGEIIAIAIGGDKRHPANPDIPTFREQGVAHDPVATFYMFASGATPRPILDRLSSEITALTKSPEFDARITKVLGVQGVGLSVDATRQFVHDEYTKLKKIADLAKIVPQ
jgi:tripartite-type tricarboxylate transporter receptor subunit TctC